MDQEEEEGTVLVVGSDISLAELEEEIIVGQEEEGEEEEKKEEVDTSASTQEVHNHQGQGHQGQEGHQSRGVFHHNLGHQVQVSHQGQGQGQRSSSSAFESQNNVYVFFDDLEAADVAPHVYEKSSPYPPGNSSSCLKLSPLGEEIAESQQSVNNLKYCADLLDSEKQDCDVSKADNLQLLSEARCDDADDGPDDNCVKVNKRLATGNIAIDKLKERDERELPGSSAGAFSTGEYRDNDRTDARTQAWCEMDVDQTLGGGANGLTRSILFGDSETQTHTCSPEEQEILLNGPILEIVDKCKLPSSQTSLLHERNSEICKNSKVDDCSKFDLIDEELDVELVSDKIEVTENVNEVYIKGQIIPSSVSTLMGSDLKMAEKSEFSAVEISAVEISMVDNSAVLNVIKCNAVAATVGSGTDMVAMDSNIVACETDTVATSSNMVAIGSDMTAIGSDSIASGTDITACSESNNQTLENRPSTSTGVQSSPAIPKILDSPDDPPQPNFCFFNDLPEELLLKIFSYLTPMELCQKVAPVCQTWHDLAYEPTLWMVLKIDPAWELTLYELSRIFDHAAGVRNISLRGRNGLLHTEYLKLCHQLTDLDLGLCDNVDVEVIRCVVTHCPFVSCLNVEGCTDINFECVKLMTSLSHLSHVNLSYCKLENDSIIFLAYTLDAIVSFNIDGISLITDEAIIALCGIHKTTLRYLELDGEEMTDVSMEVVTKCLGLHTLRLSFCDHLSDHSLQSLKELKDLKKLKLRRGHDFSEDALLHFFQNGHLSHVLDLDMSECPGMRDSSVLALVQCCGSGLLSLALCWCYTITDVGLTAIVDHCSKLKSLFLTGIHRPSGDCLDRIPEDMTSLQLLDLQNCNNINDKLICEMIRYKPDLKVINYYGEVFVYGES